MPDEIELRRLTPADAARLAELNAVFGEAFEDPEHYGAAPPDEAYLAGLLAKDHVVALAALAGVRDRAPRAGLRALETLRGLHSGRPGDYAAFTAAGVAVLGGLLALAVG